MKDYAMFKSKRTAIKAGTHDNTYFFGVKWDVYKPEVETKLTQDLLGLTTKAQGRNLCVVCESNEADRVFLALGIKRISASTFATMWILYSTTDDIFIEAPEHATTVLIRDMHISVAAPVLDPNCHMPYSLDPQGRVTPSRLNLNRPAPNSSAKPDTMFVNMFN